MGGQRGIVVGVDIGGTKTAVVLGRAQEEREIQIIDRQAFPTQSRGIGWRRVVEHVTTVAMELLEKHGFDPHSIHSIGISCGGPLDSRSGRVLSPPNLPGWDNVPLTDELERALGCRAYLQNDANACALAEWKYGAGRGVSSMVFLTFGTGMGAGLILGGRLYEGVNDLAGEVGHIRLEEDGPLGYGKRGSFEGFCSGGGIARLARDLAERSLAAGEPVAFCPDTRSLDLITTQAVGQAAEAGDPLAIEVLAKSGRYLGKGLSILIDVLNPERIVIGSIFVRCERFLRPAMEREIGVEALAPAARVCAVVPAALGESLGDYACLSVAMQGS